MKTAFSSDLDIEDSMGEEEFRKQFASEVRDRTRNRTHANSICETLTRHQLTPASMEDINTQMNGLIVGIKSELDRRRTADLLDMIRSADEYCRAVDFESKEQNYHLIHNRAGVLRDQIGKAPTQFSHASLLPIVNHIDSLTENHYAHTVQTTAAQLKLKLLTEYYTADQHDEIRLQVEITNGLGSSPASNISIVLGPSDSPYFTVVNHEEQIAPMLRGNSGIVTHFAIKLKADLERGPAFPISVFARYRNNVGEEICSDEEQWTIRLYKEGEFREFDNPYSAYAEGGEVDSETMFVGRDALLNRLERTLTAASGKCVVMFGQKRAGKSSLLEHLRRKLSKNDECVPIKFNIYDLGRDLSESTFYRKILVSVIRDLKKRELIQSDYLEPDQVSLDSYLTMRFHENMEELLRTLHSVHPHIRLILLIDEFTEIFKQIKKWEMSPSNGLISPEFVKAWKSIVEKRYFASVLVGQDIMPAFKAAFPNEFGVTEDVRITYLAEEDARKLIEDPVGSNCYLGKAVARILDLTAGSPYYIMMICDRLVDYMNRTRSAVVTEADINKIEDDMVSGDGRLGGDKFDNLIRAGDGFQDSGIAPEKTMAICEQIAKGGQRGWCSLETLKAEMSFPGEEIESLLNDLEQRDVISCNGKAYKLRVGLFRDWLQNRG